MANYISSLSIDYKDTKQLKYGVINSCDNTTNYSSTTWSVTDNGGLTGLTVGGDSVNGVTVSTANSGNYLVVTNTYTGTTSDPVITVKASSNLVSCDTNNTCAITLKRACMYQPVIFEVEINNNLNVSVTSVTGDVKLRFGVITDTTNTWVGWCGEINVDGIGNYTASKIDIPSNCRLNNSNGKGIYFNFYDTTLNISLSNNIQNIAVSGRAEYKFDGDTYQTLDNLPSSVYTYSSTNNSISITECDYTTTQLNGLLDGFKILYIKHIITLGYNESSEYVIIFKKGELPIEFIESKLMPMRYTFDLYYRPKDSFEEQSASGIITSVSSSSTYYTATFIGNTITLAQKIGSIGDVFPDDIEFDVNVCIKPSNVSSDICNSLPVHFTKESSGGSSKSITINWSVSYPDGLMIYNYNTSIDVGLTNYVNSDATSGSVSEDFASNITSRNISVNFSLQSAGYLGSLENKYKGKSVKVLIGCSGFMGSSSSSGNNTGCCLGSSGTAVMLTPPVDFTANFDNVSITDGAVINIDIKLTVI